MTGSLLAATVAVVALEVGAIGQVVSTSRKVPPPSLEQSQPATPEALGKPFERLFQVDGRNPRRRSENGESGHSDRSKAGRPAGELGCKIIVIRPERDIDSKMIAKPPADSGDPKIRIIKPPC
jgi:hypothetical protein